jgi:hypothetical protein
MTTGTQLLNEVQKLLINFANENNISLHAEFGTVEKFKQFVIAFTIKSLTDIGVEIAKAYDIVMGDGAYNRLADEVWTKCQ